jgi:tetratricopeptide (TPR) repeat protein
VLAWSNLGYFYLINHDTDLAVVCFQKCQFLDPEFSLGWLGHGIIAEFLGQSNATALYEHAYDLGKSVHFEVLYNFARQYIQAGTDDPHLFNMANFALQKISELGYKHPAAYNLLGLYFERQGRFESATEAFRKAIIYLDDTKDNSQVVENLARCLCASGSYSESIELYESVAHQGNSVTWAGYGLVLFLSEQHEQALTAFEEALKLCGDQETSISNQVSVLVARILALAGEEQHIEVAKQQLLHCFSKDQAFVDAILCLTSIGIITEDWTLTQSAAGELLKLEPHVTVNHDDQIDYLVSRMFLLQGDVTVAQRFFAKSVHRYPWLANRWTKYAEFVAIHSHEIIFAQKLGICAESVSSIRFSSQITRSRDGGSNSKVFRTTGTISLMEGNAENAKSNLSRAVMMNPQDFGNWLALGMERISRQDTKLAKRCSQVASLLAVTPENVAWEQILSAAVDLQSPAETNLVETIQILDSIASNHSGFLQEVAYTTLGRTLYASGELDSCIQSLKQAITLSLQSTHHWVGPFLFLASIYLQLNRVDAAILLYQTARETSKDRTPFIFESLVLIWKKEYSKALELLNVAVETMPESISIKYLQTIAFENIDAKKFQYRISKNKEFLSGVLEPALTLILRQ